jgi:hypothetical protein
LRYIDSENQIGDDTTMKASIRFCRASLALMLAGICPLALAQTNQKKEVTKDSTYVIQTSGGEGGPGFGANTFFYVGSEMAFEGGPVKGAPYSAQGTTTFTQTLADGNRINRQTASQIYRDSEGRTRREETIGGIGPWAAGGEAMQMIHINDPVAGTAFMLNPKDKTASKIMMKINMVKKPGAAVGGGTTISGDSMTIHMAPPPPLPPPGVAAATMPLVKRDLIAMKGQGTQESLGTQEFEGVQAEGTRTTFTIPAGQIGNEQPIQIINERWYSADLQVLVMTRHSDPRTGEEVYKLSNINRSEPAHQLFEIPSDYTVKENGDAMRTFKYEINTSGDKKKNEL